MKVGEGVHAQTVLSTYRWITGQTPPVNNIHRTPVVDSTGPFTA